MYIINIHDVAKRYLPQNVAKAIAPLRTAVYNYFMETQNLREHLQNELIRRCDRNPSYSLRSFAKSLDVDPSTLSQLIRGKRPISKKMTVKLATKLDVDPGLLKKWVPNQEQSFLSLQEDMFEVLSDWYHFAILELMNVKGFEADSKWIAKRLGITASEVNISIERLQRLEFIEINEEGEWIDLTGGKTDLGNPDLTTQAFRRYQKKIMHLSMESLENDSIKKRDHSGTTMAIDTSKLPKAKTLIKKFRRDLGKLLTGKNEDSVYQLQISLFPLSKGEDE